MIAHLSVVSLVAVAGLAGISGTAETASHDGQFGGSAPFVTTVYGAAIPSQELATSEFARGYFAFARDKAFCDFVGHQGNDFQITDAFWKKLNQLTAEFDKCRPKNRVEAKGRA